MELSNKFSNKNEVDKALSRVTTIKKKYEMYLPLKPQEEENFNKYFRAYEVYSSNHIEGNSYSLNDTRFTLSTGLSQTGKRAVDTQEILNINRSIDYLEKCLFENEELSEELIKNAHRIITSGTLHDFKDEGNYKRVRNWIGSIETSSPEGTPKHMKELIEWYTENINYLDPITLAVKVKYRLLKIHPFLDGNGRTSRWVLNYILRKYKFSECVIWDEDQSMYYESLRVDQSKEGKYNCSNLVVFICDSLVKTYQKKIDLLEVKL